MPSWKRFWEGFLRKGNFSYAASPEAAFLVSRRDHFTSLVIKIVVVSIRKIAKLTALIFVCFCIKTKASVKIV